MHPALQGLLIGLLAGAGLLLFEYTAAQKAARDRAKRMAQKQELSQDERARLRNMTTFGIFILPPLVAVIFWLMM